MCENQCFYLKLYKSFLFFILFFILWIYLVINIDYLIDLYETILCRVGFRATN